MQLTEQLINCPLNPQTDRPTVKAWRMNKKHIESLEDQLQRASHESGDTQARGRSKGLLKVVQAGARNKTLRGQEDQGVLAQLCHILGLEDGAQLPAAVKSMSHALNALPKLEAFVKDVCAFLARHMLPYGQHLSPEEACRRYV